MRNSFDRELEELNYSLIKMGGIIEKAIDLSIHALSTRNPALCRQIIKDDDIVDNMEREIESKCLRLLQLQQPVARDLRIISTALKMITDMERIGDQAADIAEIALLFDGKIFIKELDHIPQMADIAAEMVKQSIDAYVRHDMELASKVMKRDDEVDELFDIVKVDLVQLIVQDEKNADQAIDLLMIAKYLERIADHAVNLGEWVIFSITGEHKNTRII